jgi:hypothetical protein
MKKLLIMLMLACPFASTLAQSNVTISYPISFATGDLGDFIDKTSWRGFSLDYRYMVQTNMAVGLNVSWTTFYEEKPADTYTVDNESLHGKQFRYSNNVPMLATLAYFLKPDEHINPFISLGIGTMYTRRNTDMNLYTLEQEAWNFLLQPEIGMQVMLNQEMALAITGKYNHGFKAGSELSEAQSYFSLNVGLSFF